MTAEKPNQPTAPSVSSTARKAMTATAHVVGPGVLRVRNGMPAWEPLDGAPLLLHPERLQTLIIYGQGDLTGAALRLLWRHGVQVSFLSHSGGHMQARLCPPASHAPALAYLQHAACVDGGFALQQARLLVAGKLKSIRNVLDHLARHGQDPLFRHTSRQLKIDLGRLDRAASLDQLRGLEGAASARWHRVMHKLFPDSLPYLGRRCHPATDPVNALLSLGYMLLLSRVEARSAAVGLDPWVGVYHQRRAGKPALACDLMEPFRVPVVDQLVLGQVRQGFFRADHFYRIEQGMRLHRDHFRRFLQAFETRFTGEPKHDAFESQACRCVDNFATAVRTSQRALRE